MQKRNSAVGILEGQTSNLRQTAIHGCQFALFACHYVVLAAQFDDNFAAAGEQSSQSKRRLLHRV